MNENTRSKSAICKNNKLLRFRKNTHIFTNRLIILTEKSKAFTIHLDKNG